MIKLTISNNIGERIKQLRISLNMTQRGFGSALGTSASYISELEKGKSKPGYDLIFTLYKIYNVSLVWLIAGEGEMSHNKKAGPSQPTEDVRKAEIKSWLDYYWDNAEEDEKGWLRIEMKKKFPEFMDFLKKIQGLTGENTPSVGHLDKSA